MKNSDKRFVIPGELVGTSEEYIAGEGTFEQDGKIYSAITGEIEINTTEMAVNVKPLTSIPVVLKANDIVYGTVSDIKGSLAVIVVSRSVDKNRAIAMGSAMGSLHISKIQDEFIKDIRSAVKVGDIIRAKVIQAEPSLQLTTKDNNLGVINANCLDCALPLKLDGKSARCPRCEKEYSKKLADDYGNVKL